MANAPMDDFDDLPMRVGLGQFLEPSDDRLRYIKQLGVDDALINTYGLDDPDYEHLPGSDRMPLESTLPWSVESLTALRERFDKFGIRLNAIENVPISAYEDVILGGDDRDTQLAALKTTIRNMGEAGIPIFGYHWAASGVWRTGSATIRGGATASAFDLEMADTALTHGREYAEDELWTNYERFLTELLPVAEEAGVTMCVHPDDPPVEALGGVPRLMRNFENYKRAMELVPSDNHGLEFCLGCWSEMGEDLAEVIRYFGARDQLVYVHFRDVVGTVPAFHETFIDEGNYDAPTVLQLLDEVDFSGMMIPDHTPHVEGDTDWDHRGRAHAVGYLQGMLAMLRNHQGGM